MIFPEIVDIKNAQVFCLTPSHHQDNVSQTCRTKLYGSVLKGIKRNGREVFFRACVALSVTKKVLTRKFS